MLPEASAKTALTPGSRWRSGGSGPVRRQTGPIGALAWLVAAISLVTAAAVPLSRILPADAFMDLYLGRYIIEHGLPNRNVFTVAAHSARWVDQQWLAHVAYYAAWLIGGYAAVAILSVALVASGFAMLGWLLLNCAIRPTAMFAWTAAAFAVCWSNLLVRAQSFAYLFLGLTLWLVVTDRRAPSPRRRTWLVLPVLVLWANTHGSVLLGAALVVLYAGYSAAKSVTRRDHGALARWVTLAVASAGSPLVTPYGLAIIGYYRHFVDNPVIARYSPEWRPPSFTDPLAWPFFAMIAVTALAVVIAWRRGARPDLLLCGFAVVTVALGLTAYRDIPWFGFCGALLAAETLAGSRAGDRPALSAMVGRLLAGTLAVTALFNLGVLALTPDSLFEEWVPRKAVDLALSVTARGRVLGDSWTGTAILWLHPGLIGRVGYDIRIEQYTSAELTTSFGYLCSQDWQRATRGYRVVVLSRARCLANPELPRGWRVRYEDRTGIVLTHGKWG